MLLSIFCRFALLVGLIIPLMQADDEDYGPLLWCNNQRVPCVECDLKTGICFTGVKDKYGKCLEKKSFTGGSIIDSESLEHFHVAHDYALRPTAAGDSGCGPCGITTSGPDSAILPDLEVTRIHRQRVAYLPSSFGPGCFQAYDTAMWLERGTMPGGWIAQIQDISAGAAEISWLEISPADGDAVVDGVFWDTYHQKAGALRLQAADRTAVIDPTAARYAVLTRHDGWTFTFELYNPGDSEAYHRREGRLVRFADRNGQGIDLTYVHPVTATTAELGGSRPRLRQLDRVTDAYGRQSVYRYLATQVAGRWAVSGIDLPNGTSLTYGYANGRLASVGYPDGTQSTFAYGQSGNYDTITYDDPGADGTHRRKTGFYGRSSWINPTNPADVQSQVQGQIRELKNGAGERVWFSRQDPTDARLRYLYEGANQLVRLDHTDIDHPQATNYMKNWVPGESILGKPVELSKSYELEGFNLRTITDALGRKERYTRNPRTALVVRRDFHDGTFDSILANAFAQPLREVDRLGRITDSVFDSNGNRLNKTAAVGTADAATWRWEYNARGQIIAAYDALYNPATPDLHLTTFTYDAQGQLISRTDAADVAGGPRAVTSFTYDAAGRLVSTTDASGRLVTFTYDVRNRLVSTLYADGSTETVTFGTGTNANLVVARTDRNGNQTTFAYDLNGREISRVVAANAPGSASTTTTTAYLIGTTLPSRVVSSGETRTFAYDYRNRLVSESVQPKAGTTLTATSAFDAADQLVASVDWYGRSTFHRYDVNGRLIRTVMELVPGGVPAGSDPATLPRSLALNPAYVITEQTFDAEGQTLARIDGRGIRSTFAYDAQGRLAAQGEADAVWNSATSAWDLQSIASRSEYVYDAQGNRTRTVLPRNFTRQPGGAFVVGSQGAFWTEMTYTGRNLVKTVIEAAGLSASNTVRPEKAITQYTYTPTRKMATQIDPRGFPTDAPGAFTTKYLYGTCCDRLSTVIEPGGFQTTFTYDRHGNRLSVTDANTNVTAMAYDGRHRMIQTTNGAGEVTRLAYDDSLVDGLNFPELAGGIVGYPGLSTFLAGLHTGLGLDTVGAGVDGQAALTINPKGEFALEIRDGLGRVAKRVDGNRNAVKMVYDTVASDGLVETAQSDALTQVTKVRSDGAGRARKAIDALGFIATSAFDANGNRVQSLDANSVGMTCTFDARNRDSVCTTTRSDVPTTTSRTYDAHNNVLTETDALGKVTVCTYDARDRKTTSKDRINALTTFRYDLVSNLTRIIDAEGNELVPGAGITDYTYDGRNLLRTESFPTGSTGRTVRTYTYDGGKRLTSRRVTTSPATSFSELTSYAYDRANRLKTRGYPDGKNDTFSYDLASRLTSAITARYGITVNRSFDVGGRLTSEKQTITNGSVSGTTVSPLASTVSYQYDADNRTTRITYPNGKFVTRGFTARDQLASVAYDGASVANRSYDHGGRLTQTTYGNAIVENRTYVPGAQLVKTIASTPTSFTYSYDANGRKLTETDTVIAANNQTFSYDNQDRLTSWSKAAGVTPAQTQSWNLSRVGDWIATVKDGVTESRTHNRAHEVTAVGSKALTYDAKGNLTADDQGQIYTWDFENRLATATVPPRIGGPASSSSYAYDALGRRLAKTVNGRTTRFWHDGAQVVQEAELAAVPSQAAVNGTEADGTTASAALTPASGGILAGSGVTRINFQPEATLVPAGFLADKGKAYGVRTNGKTYGWIAAQTGRQQVRNYQTLAELDTCARLMPTSGDIAGVWEIALPNGTYPVIVVCGDPLSTQQTNHLTIEGAAVTDPDPSTSPGYAQGDFDGYAVTATVSDGRLTIASGTGAADPKLCFVEIGAAGGTIDSAAQTRLADLVGKATDATYQAAQGFASRAYVYASYVDEPVMMVSGAGTKHYFHQNHLYSVAAMTDSSGAVVERYRYDAYGKRTVANAAGTPIAASTIGQQRGVTGYRLDNETGLYHANARMFSCQLGRFISRDPYTKIFGWSYHGFATDGDYELVDNFKNEAGLDYYDGMSLYAGYFAMWQELDPSGMQTVPRPPPPRPGPRPGAGPGVGSSGQPVTPRVPPGGGVRRPPPPDSATPTFPLPSPQPTFGPGFQPPRGLEPSPYQWGNFGRWEWVTPSTGGGSNCPASGRWTWRDYWRFDPYEPGAPNGGRPHSHPYDPAAGGPGSRHNYDPFAPRQAPVPPAPQAPPNAGSPPNMPPAQQPPRYGPAPGY